MRYAMLMILLMASGCATSQPMPTAENYNKKLDGFVNKPLSDLVESWGVPSGEYKVDNETKMIEFKRSNGRSSVTMYGVTDDVELLCVTNFTVKNGIVKSYKYRGNICRSN